MAANQFQENSPFIAATDDRTAKIQNLEHEVHIIKTSIKSMLMNIRDALNDRSYTFTPYVSARSSTPLLSDSADEARSSAIAAKEASLDARESRLDAARATLEVPAAEACIHPGCETSKPAELPRAVPPRPLVAEQFENTAALTISGSEKLQLQKIHQLFTWTREAVGKFGHDRLGIMLESYCVMGYLPRKTTDQIREMSRIMPANLGDAHEVGPDEFVCEIYALNRILAPEDTSFDRDMIEVLMEQRQQEFARKQPSARKGTAGEAQARERRPASRSYQIVEEWINLPI